MQANTHDEKTGGHVAGLFAMRVTLALVLFVALSLLWAGPALATAPAAHPSTAGQLQVEGSHLTDSEGNNVVLRGVSTHGLQWYPEYVNDELFSQLSDEWDCNLVRLAMYSDDYCGGNREENLRVLHEGIDACIASDMYVLVDWHILSDNDPNINLAQAMEFFAEISAEYAGVPNLLFEICNEPNGETTWSDVHAYADQVIPVIRANSPDAVVIVGTPVYDRELMMAARDPIEFDNVMYTLHFYTASHDADLQGELLAVLDAGLPVFVTECGLSEASGDGNVDFDSAVTWFSLLAEHDVSFVVWSLSNKAEASALIRPTSAATTRLSDDDLTPVGLWVRALIQGVDPALIPLPDPAGEGPLADIKSRILATLDTHGIESARSWPPLALLALAVLVAGLVVRLVYRRRPGRSPRTYDDLAGTSALAPRPRKGWHPTAARVAILASTLFTLAYLAWRIRFSLPLGYGALAIAASVLLLVVEVSGFVESLIHHEAMLGIREHPLPKIDDEDFPDVDIFIATYNESCNLLRRTINGCNHLRYPDKSKVHVWVCDDNRRPQMRALAEEMGVGYFDRPDNKGAKAGNLNHALGLTSAPYVVTLDADMIVRSDFLLKTIPYFVDAERHAAELPDESRVHLGLLQTPQAFYDPDVFQHALYSENYVTNEQDFFYRTIEVARTSTNSVIYGGSNTVLSRAALEAVGGFYTESITEDFATGLLIESAGFVSLALSEPLASGRAPRSYKDHVKQRTRWGRGVIVTARRLRLLTRKGLSVEQRLSYWSSVAYWYSPLKNLVYVLAPLLFATFGIPVFACSWLDLLVYWLPMFLMQNVCLRAVSGNTISARWSGIHETSVMPALLVPVLKESLGISLSAFKVTDKSSKATRRQADMRSMAPFVVLLALTVVGLVRVIWLLVATHAVGLAAILFWLIRNGYYLLMALFLIDGRDSDGEPVRVVGAEPVIVTRHDADGTSTVWEGVATVLNEHGMRMLLDESDDLALGDHVEVSLDTGDYRADVRGAVVGLVRSRGGTAFVHTVEILDYGTSELEYLQILYDRVPSLPQALRLELGALGHLWRNVAFRMARTVR